MTPGKTYNVTGRDNVTRTLRYVGRQGHSYVMTDADGNVYALSGRCDMDGKVHPIG